MGAGIIGAKPGSTMAMATDGRAFGVGDLYEDSSGNQWVFVKASASFGQYDVVTYDETYNTTVAALSTSNDARGDKCGVAAVAFASGDYGWLQIYGPCTMNVKASCAANVRINTTTTAGSLDQILDWQSTDALHFGAALPEIGRASCRERVYDDV